MPTNVTVNTTDAQAVVAFQDGTHLVVPPQSEENFQLVSEGFCSINEAAVDPNAPVIDNSLPSSANERFITAWRKVTDAIRDEINEDVGDPVVTPVR